jgi:hypothetical protein
MYAQVFTQSAETYALDPEMAEKLRAANPEVKHSLPVYHYIV